MQLRQLLRRLMLRWAAVTLPRPSQNPWPPSRFLALRPDHLGDLLFTVPALRLLRGHFTNATLDLAVGPWSYELAQAMPYIDRIFSFSFPGFQRQKKGGLLAPYADAIRLAGRLRGYYDAAILFRPDHWWGALVARLAGIPVVAGYRYPEMAPFITHGLDGPLYLHQVELAALLVLQLVEALPTLPKPPEPKVTDLVYCPCCEDFQPHRRPPVPRLLDWRDHPLEVQPHRLPGSDPAPVGQPYAVLHPGAGATIKHWSVDGFGEICRGLTIELGIEVVVTGSASERELTNAVAEASGVAPRVLAGTTSLRQMAHLLRHATLAVGVDSGPMHLAVALGTPTVQLYGPTDPMVHGPWGDPQRHRVVQSPFPCHPCGKLDFARPGPEGGPCMLAIKAIDVMDHIRDLVEATGAHRH